MASEIVKNALFLVLGITLALLLVANVSAFGTISQVEVNGVEALGGVELAHFSGQTVPVLIVFDADSSATDVRVKAWISGERENTVSTERFDVIADRTYSRVVSVPLPSDLDENLDEDLKLNILVESRQDGTADEVVIPLTVQRESYVIDVLDADLASKVVAGEVLTVDVVLKNFGRRFANDNFVRVSIPALGIEDRAYFGDLSALDQSDPDKEDAVERRLFLRIPSNAPAGVYNVEVEAFNDDSVATLTRKVAVVGAEAGTTVVAPVHSKSFNAGETGTYTMTLVNTGDRIMVYELIVESSSGLDVTVDEAVVAVPAGTSRTVKVMATADKAGEYGFAVNVYSGSELVKRESFTAEVTGGRTIGTGNVTVVLTVILAIIFIVLLVVLIVLLTRKPEKREEFGESYY